MNYVGIDMHKQFSVAVMKNEQGNKITEEKFANDDFAFIKFLAFYFNYFSQQF